MWEFSYYILQFFRWVGIIFIALAIGKFVIGLVDSKDSLSKGFIYFITCIIFIFIVEPFII